MAFRELRVNEQIRIPNIRLFDDETNEAFGIVPIDQARLMAVERELDLVEVAPQAVPPVCRLMDYGRFKFEALKKEKESRREHSIIRVKEMKLRPKISEHDFQTKFGYVRHFLKDGDKVKLTIMFRGREMVHQEYGRKLLDRMAEELKEMAIVERSPLVEGRNMIMILSPLAKKVARADHHDDTKVTAPGRAAAPADTESSAGVAPESAPAGAAAGGGSPPSPGAESVAAEPREPGASQAAAGAPDQKSTAAEREVASPGATTSRTATSQAPAEAGKGVTSSDAQDSNA